jgi:hypothetical protein
LEWLPPQYDVGKRKYLLLETEDGPSATKEHDLVVFHPHCPISLRENDGVLASGVAAAFSLKRTITRRGITEAYEDAAILRSGMKIREGTPRDHLAPPVFFGLLGESHEWKNMEDPKEKIRKLADDLDHKVTVPREGLDMLCIADLGYWVRSTSIVKAEAWKSIQIPDSAPKELADFLGTEDMVISGLRHDYTDQQPLSPLTHFIGSLWAKLTINDPTLRPLADGFRITKTFPEREVSPSSVGSLPSLLPNASRMACVGTSSQTRTGSTSSNDLRRPNRSPRRPGAGISAAETKA